MKQVKLILLVALMTLGSSSMLNAQTDAKASKIAHISTQKLVQQLPQYKSAMSQLQKLEKTYKSDIDDMLKEMKSNFVEKRAYLMVLKMESRVAEALREKGIKPSKNPPIKLIVEAHML